MSDDDELAETLPIQPGMVIGGKYRVVKLLAAGGMGAVLLAHHEILDKPVAIKLIRPELATRREIAQRFLREARAAAKIQSDHVARVTDVDMFDDKTPFMVMEFLEGEDLHDVMAQKGKLPLALAVDYALQALLGLDAAHARGVVHRDLKPSNLFLEKAGAGRRVKLLDFGISKIIDQEDVALKAGATTSAGQMLGTPRYMSPEQVADAKTVDGRTDLWAIALILYEMLTATYPFEGSSSGQILANILTAPIAPLRDVISEAPEDLEEVMSKCLAKDREQRYTTAVLMMRALAPFASKRMRAIVSEHDEVAGSDEHTQKSPAIPKTPTPSEDGDRRSQPSAADQVATKIEVAMKQTEVDSSKDVPVTRISGQPSAPKAPADVPAKTPTKSEDPKPRAKPPGSATDAGMSVAEPKAASTATWKIGAVVVAAGALAAGVFMLTRDPATKAAATGTSVTNATTPLAQHAGTSVTAEEASPGAPTTAPTVVVTPATAATTTTSAAAQVATTASASGGPTVATPTTNTVRPKPSATAATPSSGSGGMIRTRD